LREDIMSKISLRLIIEHINLNWITIMYLNLKEFIIRKLKISMECLSPINKTKERLLEYIHREIQEGNLKGVHLWILVSSKWYLKAIHNTTQNKDLTKSPSMKELKNLVSSTISQSQWMLYKEEK
jgi:hypothetical protein